MLRNRGEGGNRSPRWGSPDGHQRARYWWVGGGQSAGGGERGGAQVRVTSGDRIKRKNRSPGPGGRRAMRRAGGAPVPRTTSPSGQTGGIVAGWCLVPTRGRLHSSVGVGHHQGCLSPRPRGGQGKGWRSRVSKRGQLRLRSTGGEYLPSGDPSTATNQPPPRTRQARAAHP